MSLNYFMEEMVNTFTVILSVLSLVVSGLALFLSYESSLISKDIERSNARKSALTTVIEGREKLFEMGMLAYECKDRTKNDDFLKMAEKTIEYKATTEVYLKRAFSEMDSKDLDSTVDLEHVYIKNFESAIRSTIGTINSTTMRMKQCIRLAEEND
ncbi:TPA: hypothetical protein ACMDQG_003616 [Vibrio cholerae]